MENGEARTLSDGGKNDPRPEHRLSLFSYYLGTTVLPTTEATVLCTRSGVFDKHL